MATIAGSGFVIMICPTREAGEDCERLDPHSRLSRKVFPKHLFNIWMGYSGDKGILGPARDDNSNRT